jgi:hypothetical protein
VFSSFISDDLFLSLSQALKRLNQELAEWTQISDENSATVLQLVSIYLPKDLSNIVMEYYEGKISLFFPSFLSSLLHFLPPYSFAVYGCFSHASSLLCSDESQYLQAGSFPCSSPVPCGCSHTLIHFASLAFDR